MEGAPQARKEIRGFRFNRTKVTTTLDRKSTRLNSSHTVISYAVFCLKKKKKKTKKKKTNTSKNQMTPDEKSARRNKDNHKKTKCARLKQNAHAMYSTASVTVT